MRCDEAVDEDHEHAHQHHGSGIAPGPAARGEVGRYLDRFRVPGAVSLGNHGPVCCRGCHPDADRVRVLGRAESLAFAETRGQAVGRLVAEVGGCRLLPGEAAVPWVGDRVVGSAIEGKAQQRTGRRLRQVDLVLRHPHNPSAPTCDAREVIALPRGLRRNAPQQNGRSRSPRASMVSDGEPTWSRPAAFLGDGS
jgi:hypothetical protein